MFAVWDWDHFGMSLVAAAAFGVLGIVMLLVGFKAFERITPKLDIEAELARGNVAVGVMVAAMLLAIALILVVAIGG
jgi:putative membrane protein